MIQYINVSTILIESNINAIVVIMCNAILMCKYTCLCDLCVCEILLQLLLMCDISILMQCNVCVYYCVSEVMIQWDGHSYYQYGQYQRQYRQ